NSKLHFVYADLFSILSPEYIQEHTYTMSDSINGNFAWNGISVRRQMTREIYNNLLTNT
ncbi:hypothetical protein LCGC14_1646900, partial [marine sediment metagenome]